MSNERCESPPLPPRSPLTNSLDTGRMNNTALSVGILPHGNLTHKTAGQDQDGYLDTHYTQVNTAIESLCGSIGAPTPAVETFSYDRLFHTHLEGLKRSSLTRTMTGTSIAASSVYSEQDTADGQDRRATDPLAALDDCPSLTTSPSIASPRSSVSHENHFFDSSRFRTTNAPSRSILRSTQLIKPSALLPDRSQPTDMCQSPLAEDVDDDFFPPHPAVRIPARLPSTNKHSQLLPRPLTASSCIHTTNSRPASYMSMTTIDIPTRRSSLRARFSAASIFS